MKSRLATALAAIALLAAAPPAGAVALSPLLWKLEAQPAAGGGPPGQRMFLFGSIHFGSETMYPLPEAVEAAFADSDVLVVELDLGRVSAEELEDAVQRYGLLAPPRSARDVLSPATWSRLEAAAAHLGIPRATVLRQRPWLTAIQLSAVALGQIGYSEALGVDRHFLAKAHAGSDSGEGPRTVRALETLSQQLEVLSRLSPAQAEDFLRDTLDELENGGDFFAEVTAAWKRGDADALMQLIDHRLERGAVDEATRNALIESRNAEMGRELLSLLTSDGDVVYFVVVGVGHLVGEHGIVAALRAAGYRVERVPTDLPARTPTPGLTALGAASGQSGRRP